MLVALAHASVYLQSAEWQAQKLETLLTVCCQIKCVYRLSAVDNVFGMTDDYDLYGTLSFWYTALEVTGMLFL